MSQPTESESAATGATQAARKLNAQDAKRRPRLVRRLLMVVGVLLLLLIIVVAALPSLLGISAVRQYALDRVNGSVAGTISAERVSLGWFSSGELSGIRVLDANEREVLRVDRITLGASLLGLATGGLNLGELRIESPVVTLHVDEANNMSLVDAFSSGAPPTPAATTQPAATGESGRALPEIRARLVVTDGAVSLQRDTGGKYDVSALDIDIDVDTLNQLTGKVGAVLDDGATLTAEVECSDLAPGGSIDVAAARGAARIATDRPVDIQSLAEVVLQQSGLTGTVALNVDAKAEPGTASANYTLAIKGLRAAAALPDAPPIDLALNGALSQKADDITGSLDLEGTPGAINARLAAARDLDFNIDVTALTNALLTGGDVALPGVELNATGDIDLVSLDRALPGMLPLQEGQRLTGGRLALKTLKIAGGTAPSINADIALTDVAAAIDGKTVNVRPITLVVDSSMKPGEGARLDRVDLTASFAKVAAQGTARDLQADLTGDLAQMKRELGEVFDLGALDFGGQIACNLKLARSDEQAIATKLEFTAQDAFFASGDARYTLTQARITQDGRLALAGQRLERIEATSLTADLGDMLAATGTGWYAPKTQGMNVSLDIKKAALDQLAGAGVGALDRFSGSLAGNISASRANAATPIVSGGKLTTSKLAVDKKPLLKQDANITWSGAAIGSSDVAELTKLDLTAGSTTVTAADVEFNLRNTLLTRGDVQAQADVSDLLEIVALVAQMESPPAIDGQLALNAKASGTGAAQKLAGGLQVTDLAVGTGEQTIREKKLDLQFDTAIDQQAQRIRLGDTRLSSGPLSASLSGAISEYDKSAVADIKGSYDASWPVLTAMLHELVPATADLVVLEGESSSEFFIRGPLSQSNATPGFRGAAGELQFGWGGARLAGIPLSDARFQPALDQGVIKMPVGRIKAAEGAVNLGGQLDLTADDLTLRMPGETRVLDGVNITPQLTREILSRINPVFYHVVSAEGQVNLVVRDLVFPVGESIKDHGKGDGELKLVDMRIKPGDFVRQLLALGGVAQAEEMLSVGVEGVTFAIVDGRIRYDNFALIFPSDFRLRFYGSVGLDDSLDLVVSLPIRVDLLRKLGVSGPVERYAAVLEGKQLDIPLVGTRQKPRLALDKVDKAKLVEQAVKALGADAVGGALEGLLKKPDAENKQKADEKKEKKPADQLEGLLRQLGGDKKKDEKKK